MKRTFGKATILLVFEVSVFYGRCLLYIKKNLGRTSPSNFRFWDFQSGCHLHFPTRKSLEKTTVPLWQSAQQFLDAQRRNGEMVRATSVMLNHHRFQRSPKPQVQNSEKHGAIGHLEDKMWNLQVQVSYYSSFDVLRTHTIKEKRQGMLASPERIIYSFDVGNLVINDSQNKRQRDTES